MVEAPFMYMIYMASSLSGWVCPVTSTNIHNTIVHRYAPAAQNPRPFQALTLISREIFVFGEKQKTITALFLDDIERVCGVWPGGNGPQLQHKNTTVSAVIPFYPRSSGAYITQKSKKEKERKKERKKEKRNEKTRERRAKSHPPTERYIYKRPFCSCHVTWQVSRII